jgi:hypothetical protein
VESERVSRGRNVVKAQFCRLSPVRLSKRPTMGGVAQVSILRPGGSSPEHQHAFKQYASEQNFLPRQLPRQESDGG